MKKTALEIYALLVCFVTVICFAIAFGLAAYGVLGIASPSFTMSSFTYAQYQTNDAFWNVHGTPSPSRRGADDTPKERPNEAELTKQREAAYDRALVSERRDNLQSVVKSLIVIFIDVILLLLHGRIVRRERRSAA